MQRVYNHIFYISNMHRLHIFRNVYK